MTKKTLIVALLLFASVCHADLEKTGPWEVSAGADSVITFQPEYVPPADNCYGFIVRGRPDEVFVSPVLPGKGCRRNGRLCRR